MSMNKFIGIGRWSTEIEFRFTPNGKAVANANIAINEKYGNNETTTFLPVVMWGKTAEVVSQYSRKGMLVAVEGRIQVRHYDNNEGRRVYVTEVIADNVRFLESNRQGQQQGQPAPQRQSNDPFANDGQPVDVSDWEMPF